MATNERSSYDKLWRKFACRHAVACRKGDHRAVRCRVHAIAVAGSFGALLSRSSLTFIFPAKHEMGDPAGSEGAVRLKVIRRSNPYQRTLHARKFHHMGLNSYSSLQVVRGGAQQIRRHRGPSSISPTKAHPAPAFPLWDALGLLPHLGPGTPANPATDCLRISIRPGGANLNTLEILGDGLSNIAHENIFATLRGTFGFRMASPEYTDPMNRPTAGMSDSKWRGELCATLSDAEFSLLIQQGFHVCHFHIRRSTSSKAQSRLDLAAGHSYYQVSGHLHQLAVRRQAHCPSFRTSGCPWCERGLQGISIEHWELETPRRCGI